MGFAEQAESWRAKAHLTGVRLPVLVGVTALAAIVLIAAGGALVKAGTSDGFSLSRDDGAATSDGTDEDGAASGEARTVFVHVGGAVVEPGVRELAEGARVQDAVDAAGGFADGAARDALNLARVLADGERIDLEGVRSYFGRIDARVRSHVGEGYIEATVTCDPERKPSRLAVRLPHPQSKKPVRITGGRYDETTESVLIDDFDGEASIRLEY